MLIFYLLIILLSSVSISKINDKDIKYIGEELEMEIKNQQLSSRMTEFCNLTYLDNAYSPYRISCSHDDPKDDVEIEVSNVEYYDTTSIKCKNVSSFKLIPDLTDHYGNSKVMLKNCMVPKNKSINQLTNKISRTIKCFTIQINNNKRKLNLDNYYFEGLLSLETLEIDLYRTNTTTLNSNVFEHLGNLRSLVLHNSPLPDSIFDTLTNLQELTIRSVTYNEFNGSNFKNQRNLIQLYIYCDLKCSLDSFVKANLRNLEKLTLENFQISRIMLSNMLNLKSVVIWRCDFKTFHKHLLIKY